jgi:histidinol-phosphate/aromatic aminotransferase/cobyric acid decarboxylase-like protein
VSAHGGDVAAVARAAGLDRRRLIDLSASMNPFAPDIRPLLADALDVVVDYPDATRAHAALAEVLDVDRDRLVLTNGGAEAIALVAAELGAGSVVEPEFSLYRRHLARVDSDAPRWRSNPSNPLGMLADDTDAAHVWDEAFLPLATGRWTNGRGAWRLGSLTKVWACPGLRLGYAIAPDADAAARIARRQPRWSVNGLALSIVEPMLAVTDLPGWASQIEALRAEFCGRLHDVGVAARPTAANWVLVEGVDAADLRRRLIDRRVLIRDCTSFGMADTCRVALPNPHDLDVVVDAFARS